MGAQMAHALAQAGIPHRMKSLAIDGEFGQSAYMAEDLYKKHGLTAAKIVEAAQGTDAFDAGDMAGSHQILARATAPGRREIARLVFSSLGGADLPARREGAFGLILNRASRAARWARRWWPICPRALKEQPLYLGGPVQPQALSFLHSDRFCSARQRDGSI